MRALAHPVRLQLLELLGRDGPLTATQAGALLDELPGNISWHFRILARHGLVTEAEGGNGRRRPWKLVAAGQRFDAEPATQDERLAADELLRTVADQAAARVRAWLATRYADSASWRRASALSDWTLYMTAEETQQLRDQVYALFQQFSDRAADPARRPATARPVKGFLSLHPMLIQHEA